MKEVSLASRYDALPIESKWYECWEKSGIFTPSLTDLKPTYSITIPPPNITGSLHLGSVLCYSLQDALGRYKRLTGYNVLILPGQDHAGIATQSIVEKQLRKEGTSGNKIGREKFVERVWQWRKESGDTILQQFRSFGCSFDWTRLRFTLDEDYANTVLDVFIDWFDRGLIFRGKRVVTWDPALQTSLSDMETERKIVKGKLYHLKYEFTDGSGAMIVATTRPETIFADVAVAVHPSDKRYSHLVGKMMRVPLSGKEIPLIADIYPDPEFGTGALKITPAHDANDFAVGQRHNLEMPIGIDLTGKLTEIAGPYKGLDRFEARRIIGEALTNVGLLEKEEEYEIPLVISERSGEPVEPLLSEQWFVNQPLLAGPVLKAMNEGEFKFTPARYNQIFVDWLTGIKEWCISRQLWWGHRIPIFYTEDGTPVAARNTPEAEAKCGKKIVRQDDDVLDTWFSSGLWPFATLGWPKETEDLKKFFPTQVLITDRNIINLWVSRMAMMSYDLLGERPFDDVMIYATVLNEKGQRMSKSLGTGIDPTVIIDAYGADTLRWTLHSQTGDNQDLKFSPKKVEESRNFCNKIWNATRFILMNLSEEHPAVPDSFDIVDKWILSKLANTEAIVRKGYDEFDFLTVCQTLYRFFWNDFADWYIEAAKPRLNDESSANTPRWVLLTVITAFLKMLHPIMPFVTEELYSNLPKISNSNEMLIAADWPKIDQDWTQSAIENQVEAAFDTVRELRALRASLDQAAMKPLPVAYYQGDLGEMEELVRTQAWFKELKNEIPSEKAFVGIASGIKVFMPLGDFIDAEKELKKISTERLKLQSEFEKLEARLQNPQFVERAKPEIVEKEKEGLVALSDRLIALASREEILKTI